MILSLIAATGWGAAFFATWLDASRREAGEREVLRLRGEVSAARNLADAEAQLQAARAERDDAIRRRDDARESLTALEVEILQMHGEAKATSASFAGAASELERLRAQLASGRERLAQVESSARDAEQRLAAARKALTAAEEAIGERTIELAEAGRRLAELRRQIMQAEARIAERSTDLAQAQQRVGASLADLVAAQARTAEQARSLAELDTRRAALIAEVDGLRRAKEEGERERERLARLAQDARALDEALDRRRAEVAVVQQRLDAINRELVQARTSAEDARRTSPAPQPVPRRPSRVPADDDAPRIEDRPDGSRIIRIVPSFPSRP